MAPEDVSQFPEEEVKYDDGLEGNDGVRKPFGSDRDSGLQIDGILVDKSLVYKLVGHTFYGLLRKLGSNRNTSA